MIEEKAVDILNKLESLTTQYAPDVLDLAVEAMRINALSKIGKGFIILVLIVIVAAVAYKIAMHFYDEYARNNDDITADIAKHANRYERSVKDQGYEVPIIYTIVIGVIIIGCLLPMVILSLGDTWNWVALFNPKLALAKQVLGL